jgi:hypothetical protein
MGVLDPGSALIPPSTPAGIFWRTCLEGGNKIERKVSEAEEREKRKNSLA